MPLTEQTSQTSNRTPQTAAAETLRRTVQDPETFGTTLLVLVIDRLGVEAVGWAPETLRLELAEVAGAPPCDAAFDKLMAAVSILTSDAFFQELPAFIRLCNVLAGGEMNPEVFDVADSVECAWGITEALLISPPEGRPTPELFAPEIRYYIGQILKAEGYVQAPDVLGVALDDESRPQPSDTWADDPEMFAAAHDVQAGRAQEVTEAVKGGLADLVQQVSRLPLENGDTAAFVKNLPANMRPG